MASEYLIPGPLADDKHGSGFLGSPGAASRNVAGSGFNPGVAPGSSPGAVPGSDEDSRFRPGSLSPTTAASRRTGKALRARRRSGPLRVLNLALLTAEIISALIVSWLVAQYIYTVYIDTVPRRVSPPTGQTAHPILPAGVLTTPTPTRIAQVTPPLLGAPGGGVTWDGG
ncbi:MAG: hypothetical protein ACJ78Q_13400, partial [Chloroflexia bacterium]